MPRCKTFTGCWRCRERKVKCDGGQPSCKRCIRRGDDCPGYSVQLVWVDSAGSEYTESRRRLIDVESTWAGHNPLDGEELLALLSRDGAGQSSQTSFFNVFQIDLPNSRLPWANSGSLMSSSEQELLHHSVTVLADLMMPTSDTQSPWKTVYPRLARARATTSQSALFHAILAHSAAHKANLCPQQSFYRSRFLYHHVEAMAQIRRALSEQPSGMSSLLASLRTLIMLDVYSESSTSAWRQHLAAAWHLLLERSDQGCERLLDDDWSIAQSVCLAQLRKLTLSPTNSHSSTQRHDEYNLLKSMASDLRYGFSIGAESHWLLSLTEIQFSHSPSLTSSLIQSLEIAINSNSNSNPSALHDVSSCSTRIFQLGLLIHLKRRAAAVPPRSVTALVSPTFDALAPFVEYGGKEPTVWPVFFAAVEAVEERQQARARQWLGRGVERGIASRARILWLLEEVWVRRAKRADEARVGVDLVVVEWREVVGEMGMDLPLVS